MRVASIQRTNYMIPGTHRLDLPETGLVLITGGNGTGKSSWIDAVGTAWNATVRDDKARKSWGNLPDLAASVEVKTHDGARVKRAWSKAGKTGLAWSTREHTDTGTTRSKSQKALVATVGDYRGWLWSNVIASDSADMFTTATNAQRREILEDVLDLQLLASTHMVIHEDTKQARRDLKEQDRTLDAAAQSAQLLADSEQAARAALDGLPSPAMPDQPAPLERPARPREVAAPAPLYPSTPRPPEPLAAPADPPQDTRGSLIDKELRMVGDRAVLQAQVSQLRVEEAQACKKSSDACGRLERAQSAQQKVSQAECPTCAQEISQETAASFVQQVADATALAQEADREATRTKEHVSAQVGECEQHIVRLVQKMAEGRKEIDHIGADLRDHATRLDAWEAETERRASTYQKALVDHKTLCAALGEIHLAQVAECADENARSIDDYETQLASMESRTKEQAHAHAAKCGEVWDRHEMHCLGLRRAHQEAQARSQGAHTTLHEAQQQLATTRAALALSELGEKVTGPDGPRATLLNGAMRAVGATANEVLAQIGSHLRVKLYAEGKDVGLTISGACADKYVGLSNGERRRVNLAILMALGDVASSTRGQTATGTLFLDEFLDSVDLAGMDDVCAYVALLARTRCVVVITHREMVMSRLRPVKSVTMVRE